MNAGSSLARIRSIKPEFWSDSAIIECSTNARLLFVGTWNFADDHGNLDRSAKQLKAQVFPADNIDCEPLIQELLARRLLVEYSVNGKDYLHIQGFRKHQRIDRPGPPRCPLYEGSQSVPRIFDEDSSSIRPRKGREGKGSKPLAPVGAFERFWQAYPKKRSRDQALRAFEKINPDEQLLAVIVAAVERAKTRADWLKDRGQFIPYPATWLNAGGWKDEDTPLATVERRAVV